MQLNASDSGEVCSGTNLIAIRINENTNGMNARRHGLDDLPGNLRLNVTRALRIKVKTDQMCAEFDAGLGIPQIRDAADFNLHRSHDGIAVRDVCCSPRRSRAVAGRSSTVAMRSRSASPGSAARIRASPMRNQRNPRERR